MTGSRHFLVLGGTGFVGSAVVQVLLRDPTVRLTLLVHRRPFQTQAERVRVLRGSLNRVDWQVFAEDPPLVVIHLARRLGRGRSGRWLTGWLGQLANRRLIAGLCALPAPPRVVYVSGSLMYGSRGEDWVEETTPLQPISFARQYARAEMPFLRAQARATLPVILVRPPWILGGGSWFNQFFLEPAREQAAVPCYGPGDNWMTFIHLADCAALTVHLANRGVPGEAYNLACPPPWRQRQFVSRLAERLGLPVRQLPWSALPGDWDPALREALGSSIRLRSRHAHLLAECPCQFGDPDAALAEVLSQVRTCRLKENAD